MTPDGRAICDELRAAAKALGWCQTGRLTGRDRTALYRAFTGRPNGHGPSFQTITEVAEALGYRLVLVPPRPVQQSTPEE